MKEDSIEKIALELKNIQLSPHELVEKRLWLSGEYAYLSGQLTEILMDKPAIWNELRRGVGSDTAAERVWQATENGLRETKLRLQLKSIEKLMTAIKTKIEIDLGEARNQF